jgi:lactate dehydrogenase-like 2-hydroxyacid dehydrogenase
VQAFGCYLYLHNKPSSLLPASCKIYASAGAGFDWVDTKCLAKRGVIYCNAAAACTESVADAAIWLVLSTFRNFTSSALAARSLDVNRYNECHRNISSTTHNPCGHALGIIGLGKIGYRIAQKAQTAFGMKILYNDIARMSPEMERSVGAQFFDQLDDMLATADCVVLATPFAGEKVLNRDKIAKMKPGSRLVNIARGKLVDEEALVSALESGRIVAAGLDVHYNEPHVNPKLARMTNVELLTHIAGSSVESHIGFERIGMENIQSFFDTGEAISPVNLQWIQEPSS